MSLSSINNPTPLSFILSACIYHSEHVTYEIPITCLLGLTYTENVDTPKIPTTGVWQKDCSGKDVKVEERNGSERRQI